VVPEEVHRQLDDHPLVVGDELGERHFVPGGTPLDERGLASANLRPSNGPSLFH
jgi:hypothetical protein